MGPRIGRQKKRTVRVGHEKENHGGGKAYSRHNVWVRGKEVFGEKVRAKGANHVMKNGKNYKKKNEG